MTKLLTIVDAPATSITVARVSAPNGDKSVVTLLFKSDDASVLPAMAGLSLREEKLDEMVERFRANPMLATIFAQGIITERGVGQMDPNVKIEELTEAFPIMPIQADGYEKRNVQTGEVTRVEAGKPTLH